MAARRVDGASLIVIEGGVVTRFSFLSRVFRRGFARRSETPARPRESALLFGKGFGCGHGSGVMDACIACGDGCVCSAPIRSSMHAGRVLSAAREPRPCQWPPLLAVARPGLLGFAAFARAAASFFRSGGAVRARGAARPSKCLHVGGKQIDFVEKSRNLLASTERGSKSFRQYSAYHPPGPSARRSWRPSARCGPAW